MVILNDMTKGRRVIILEKKNLRVTIRMTEELDNKIDYIKGKIKEEHLLDVSDSEVIRSAIDHLADFFDRKSH